MNAKTTHSKWSESFLVGNSHGSAAINSVINPAVFSQIKIRSKNTAHKWNKKIQLFPSEIKFRLKFQEWWNKPSLHTSKTSWTQQVCDRCSVWRKRSLTNTYTHFSLCRHRYYFFGPITLVQSTNEPVIDCEKVWATSSLSNFLYECYVYRHSVIWVYLNFTWLSWTEF